MEIIQSCQYNFCFELPSFILQKFLRKKYKIQK